MSSDATKQFAVNWNNHMNHVKQAFDNLLSNHELTDVILYAEGKKVGAHKMLLAACSAYFRNLFQEFPQDQPIVVLKGVRYSILSDILKFIYNGEVSIDCDAFDSFLQTAEFLQISGLTDNDKNSRRIQSCREDTVEDEHIHSDIEQNCKIEKRSNSEPRQSLQTKRAKVNNSQIDFTTVKCESNTLTPIFPEELADTLQETSDLTSELFLQSASNNYSIEDSTLKIEDVEPAEVLEEHMEDSSTNSNFGTSPNNYSDNPLKCQICHKEFSHPYSLHHHKPVHLGSTKCSICHVVLSRKYNLKMHMKSRHNIV